MYGVGTLGSGHLAAGAQSKSLGQFTLNENDTAPSIGSKPGGTSLTDGDVTSANV